MVQGKVKWFNSQKGFGFIEQESGPDLFVHYSAVKGDGFKNLAENDVVEFEVIKGPKGDTATDVTVISRSAEPSSEKPRPRSTEHTGRGQANSNKPFNRSIEDQLKALRKSSKENQQDLANRLKRR